MHAGLAPLKGQGTILTVVVWQSEAYALDKRPEVPEGPGQGSEGITRDNPIHSTSPNQRIVEVLAALEAAEARAVERLKPHLALSC